MPSAQRGVVLLEALIAILIFSLGILGILGLQANMIQATADARSRVVATAAAQARLDQLWATNAFNAAEPEPGTNISAQIGLPNARRITIVNDNTDPTCILSCYTVIVRWQQPGTGEIRQVTTIGHVNLTP
jgi:type IV pilus assembly protein PilV